MTPWRAEPNDQYWFIATDMSVQAEVDTRSTEDDSWYHSGNYFQYRTIAVRVSNFMKAGLQYIHGQTDGMDKTIETLIEARRVIATIHNGGTHE